MPWPAGDINPDNRELPVSTAAFPVGYGLDSRSQTTVAALHEETLGQPIEYRPAGFAGGPRGPGRSIWVTSSIGLSRVAPAEAALSMIS